MLIDDLYKKIYTIPNGFDSYLNGYTKEKYIQLLKEIIIGDDKPEQVILLELFPEKQKTKIDFSCTEKLLGIKTVCLTELTAEGNKLYYFSDNRKIQIKRIFNRIIFDDLSKEKLPANTISLHQEYDVKWIPHPDWYYRISKFLLPFIQNQFVPETYFLHEIKMQLPLDEYVLKPLFSYAGTGVITELKQEDIDNIKNPEDYILQKKVNYASVIRTPDEAAKCEIRLFYFWHEQWERPMAVHNLARLSKGKMIGTRYNFDKIWVGSSIAYFEKIKKH
jgi:glutathionylspermidine synthase